MAGKERFHDCSDEFRFETLLATNAFEIPYNNFRIQNSNASKIRGKMYFENNMFEFFTRSCP